MRGNPKALGLHETRRLQRRAALSGKPLFLLRVAGMTEPTAAPCRLHVAPAPSVPRRTRDGPLEGSIGAPAFTITVEKARAQGANDFAVFATMGVSSFSSGALVSVAGWERMNMLALPVLAVVVVAVVWLSRLRRVPAAV